MAFVLVLSISGLAAATDEKPSDKKTGSKTRQVTGEITALDLKAQIVSVKGKNGIAAIALTDKTKVTIDKDAGTLGDLQIGDRVTIKYKDANGKQTAKSIKIKTASKKPKLPT